jgi:hypothetical protein
MDATIAMLEQELRGKGDADFETDDSESQMRDAISRETLFLNMGQD